MSPKSHAKVNPFGLINISPVQQQYSPGFSHSHQKSPSGEDTKYSTIKLREHLGAFLVDQASFYTESFAG